MTEGGREVEKGEGTGRGRDGGDGGTSRAPHPQGDCFLVVMHEPSEEISHHQKLWSGCNDTSHYKMKQGLTPPPDKAKQQRARIIHGYICIHSSRNPEALGRRVLGCSTWH